MAVNDEWLCSKQRSNIKWKTGIKIFVTSESGQSCKTNGRYRT